MKLTKLLIVLVVLLLLVHSTLAVSDASDFKYKQEGWFQKLTTLFVVSGSDKAVNGEVKTYYEVVDNYILNGDCKAGTVSKADLFMTDSLGNIVEDSGVLTQKTIVCGADAFSYPFIMHNGNVLDYTVTIRGKVYCQKTDGSYGWVIDPHPKTVVILSGGCQNTGCPSDGFVGADYCFNGNVYANYRSYTCGSDGACHSTTIRKLVEDCNGMGEKCNLDTGDSCVREDYCYSNSDCHSPYYTNEYCSNNDVVKDYVSFSCENHYCVSHSNQVLVKECSGVESCESGVCVKKDYCGDGICEADEDYNSCPNDCPSIINTSTNNINNNSSELNNNMGKVKKNFFERLWDLIMSWLNKIFG